MTELDAGTFAAERDAVHHPLPAGWTVLQPRRHHVEAA